MQCLTLMRSLGVTPANIATNNILLKTRFTGLHFRCRKYWCTFNHFYVIRPKIYRTEFGEITLRLGPLCHSRSSKVTEFGTNRKLTCNFLLVIKGWGGGGTGGQTYLLSCTVSEIWRSIGPKSKVQNHYIWLLV